jgi:hypothetical protein
MKKLIILLVLFFSTQLVYCQYDSGAYNDDIDDDEKYTIATVGFSLISGGIIAIIGFLVMQIKPLNTFGKIILGIGAFLGLGTLLMYILQIIQMLLSAAFNLAWKIAIVIAIIFVIWVIIRSIYDWICGNNK